MILYSAGPNEQEEEREEERNDYEDEVDDMLAEVVSGDGEA